MNKILNYLEDDNWYKIFDVENEEDIEYKLLEREEVQTLLEEIERQKDKILKLETEADIYKGICEVRKETIKKAIEYIKESIEVGNIKASGRGLIWVNFSTEEIENLDKLLSILEGSDKECIQ